jgi:hypothetical protein
MGATGVRRLRFVVIHPSSPVVREQVSGVGGGFIAVVNDDPSLDQDRSQGPDAFSDLVLAAYLKDSTSIVCSAEPGDDAAALLGAMFALHPFPFFVLISTQPQHHAAWTKRITTLCGHAPLIHITTDGKGPEGWDAPVVELHPIAC